MKSVRWRFTLVFAMSNISRSTSDCRIYMAPSTVASDAFGIYTTLPIEEGEYLLQGNTGPSIPVIDYHQDESPERAQWIELFDNYWWGRGVADQVLYEADTVTDFQDTFGALPNHHCVLVRIMTLSVCYVNLSNLLLTTLPKGLDITSCT